MDENYVLRFPDGREFVFDVEEAFELLHAGKEATKGWMALENMKRKAQEAFDALPKIDY